MRNKFIIGGLAVLIMVGILLMTELEDTKSPAMAEHHSEESAEFERGPHHGRLLRKDDFALEITLFEEGVPPQFHLYAYEDDTPLKPEKVQATIALSRLDGEVNSFRFMPKEDYLDGGATVAEPHSFDVKVSAVYDGARYHWEFSSYEGRVKIAPEAAAGAGIKAEQAGPGTIREKLALTGRIALDPNRSALVKARFPGVIRGMKKNPGDVVKKGDVLATVESNDSLQVYAVTSPIEGTIIARNGSVGDLAAEAPLYHVADLSGVWAEFYLFPRDVSKVKPGQKVFIKGMEGDMTAEATIEAVPPVAQTGSQSVLARASLENKQGLWRAGMNVQGEVTVAEREAPLVVKTSGLQRFRDFTVVFAQVGDVYEVRMLKLGVNDGEQAEVLEGLKPGQAYVTENSFLVKADIEKSGASHDH